MACASQISFFETWFLSNESNFISMMCGYYEKKEMVVNFKTTFHPIQCREVRPVILFSQMRKLSSQREWEEVVVCVSGCIPRHHPAGRAFFIPFTAVSARRAVGPVASLPWQQPSSPLVSALTASVAQPSALSSGLWYSVLAAVKACGVLRPLEIPFHP